MILAAQWYHTILAMVFALFAVMLMGVILLQRGKGVGLAGAFGGAGGHSAFGSKTGDVLTWATVTLAGILLLVAVLLNYVFMPARATPTPVILPDVPVSAESGASDPIVVPPPQAPPTQVPATQVPTTQATPSAAAPAPATQKAE